MRNSSFVIFFGKSPMIKVLDFLLEGHLFDYSKSEISRETGISRVTLDTFWDKLVQKQIVKKTRTIGRGQLYSLNNESPIAKKLLELDFVISKQYNDEYLEKESIKVTA